MTVGKVKKKNGLDKKTVDEFISKGGSSAFDTNGESRADDEVRMTFRCPKDLVELLDKFRQERPGRLSRNQAIVELLSASLDC